MIKITKHNVESKKIAVKFVCDCGCEFWADNSSLLNGKEKRVSHYTLYHAICPECQKEVCSINTPVDRDLVFKE